MDNDEQYQFRSARTRTDGDDRSEEGKEQKYL
jgi:hypothetical protein